MAIQFVQKDSGIQDKGETITFSIGSGLAATSAGNCLIVISTNDDNGEAISSISGRSSGWAQAKDQATNQRVEIWVGPNASGSDDVVITYDSTKVYATAAIIEFSGCKTASVVGNTGGQSGSSDTPATGNLTPTQADAVLVVGFNRQTKTRTSGPTNSFTIIEELNSASKADSTSAYRIVSSVTVYSTEITLDSSQNWDVAIVEIKAAAAPGGTAIKDIIGGGIIPFAR